MNIFKKRWESYSELESKFSSLAQALTNFPDLEIRKLVNENYEINVKNCNIR
jgi:hypothetical protein